MIFALTSRVTEENHGGWLNEGSKNSANSKGRSWTSSRRPSASFPEWKRVATPKLDVSLGGFAGGVVDWCASRTRGDVDDDDDDRLWGWVMGFICPHRRRATSSLLSFLRASSSPSVGEHRLVFAWKRVLKRADAPGNRDGRY